MAEKQMIRHAAPTPSVWRATSEIQRRSPLGTDITTDVCIVGAGIAGLTTAYLLAAEGHSVVVIDKGPIAAGETSLTTAHLTSVLDDRYYELERYHGQKGVRLAAQSHRAAIDRVERIVGAEKINCEFERVDGYLFTPPDDSGDVLEKELEAARRAGTEAEIVARAPWEDFDTGRALRFRKQAQFHPLKYLDALAQAIESKGGRIFMTQAQEFKGGSLAQVTTSENHVISANAVVVATNTPVNDWVTIHTKQAAYRSYVIGIRVPKDSVTKALYWDTLDPYHYVRLEEVARHSVLIVGGEDHKTGQADDTEDRFSRLEAWARERFPKAADVEFRWSGQVLEPFDGLGFIGRNPGDKNVYIVTGHSGNGMTYGAIAGILLTDLIAGRQNEWETLYDPSRLSLRAAAEYAKENANAMAQFSDYLTPGEVETVRDVPGGGGAIVRQGLKKVAAYRDTHGVLHEFSAICPHLGCIVDWNAAERSWDCPCHGSRFNTAGKVISGPAISGLTPKD